MMDGMIPRNLSGADLRALTVIAGHANAPV